MFSALRRRFRRSRLVQPSQRGNPARCEPLEQRRMLWHSELLYHHEVFFDDGTASASWSDDPMGTYVNQSITVTLTGLSEHDFLSVFVDLDTETASGDATDTFTLSGAGGGDVDERSDEGRPSSQLAFNVIHNSSTATFTISASGLEPDEFWWINYVDVTTVIPGVSLAAVDANATENTPGDDIVYRVSRDYVGPTNADGSVLSYPLTVNLEAPTGTATEGEDYSSIPRTVAIPAGEDHYDLHVSTIDDPTAEWEASITLGLADPSTQPYVPSNVEVATTISDDVRIESIVVYALPTAMPQFNLPEPENRFDGYFFGVEILFHGEGLDKLSVRQNIKAKTELWDRGGNGMLSTEQVNFEFPGADLNTINSPGDDYVLDTGWNWQPINIIEDSKNGDGYLLDVQGLDLQGSPNIPYGEDSTVSMAYVARVTRDFKVLTKNAVTGQELVTKDWGYVWSNQNCQWPQEPIEPPFPVIAYDLDGKKGVFSGIYGILGLSALND